MKKTVTAVLGLLLGGPLFSAAGPAVAAGQPALPPATRVLGAEVVESDLAFDDFVQGKLSANAEYQLLDNRLRQAEVRIEQEDAADSLRVSTGLKHRPAGEQNNNVSDLGGYLSIQKTLYDWGRVDNRVVSAEQDAKAQGFENGTRRGALSEELAQRYFAYVKATRDVAHMQAQLDALRTILQQLQARARGGAGSSLEHEIMADEQLSLQMEIRALELEQQKLRVEFENNYGALPADTLIPVAMLPAQFQAADWEAELLRRNPEIQTLRARIEASRSLRDAKRADYFPTLNFSATYTESDLDYQWFTTLDMSYELYNGGQARLGVEEQELKISEAMLQLKTQHKKTRDQARALLAEYEIQQGRYWIYDRILASKRDLHSTLEERMRSTKGELRELYNAQKAAIDASIKRDHAYFDAVFQAYKARLLLGE